MHKMSLSVHKNIAPKIIKSMVEFDSITKNNRVDGKKKGSSNDVSPSYYHRACYSGATK